MPRHLNLATRGRRLVPSVLRNHRAGVHHATQTSVQPNGAIGIGHHRLGPNRSRILDGQRIDVAGGDQLGLGSGDHSFVEKFLAIGKIAVGTGGRFTLELRHTNSKARTPDLVQNNLGAVIGLPCANQRRCAVGSGNRSPILHLLGNEVDVPFFSLDGALVDNRGHGASDHVHRPSLAGLHELIRMDVKGGCDKCTRVDGSPGAHQNPVGIHEIDGSIRGEVAVNRTGISTEDAIQGCGAGARHIEMGAFTRGDVEVLPIHRQTIRALVNRESISTALKSGRSPHHLLTSRIGPNRSGGKQNITQGGKQHQVPGIPVRIGRSL